MLSFKKKLYDYLTVVRFLMIPLVMAQNKSEQNLRAVFLPLLSHIGTFTFTVSAQRVTMFLHLTVSKDISKLLCVCVCVWYIIVQDYCGSPNIIIWKSSYGKSSYAQNCYLNSRTI